MSDFKSILLKIGIIQNTEGESLFIIGINICIKFY